MSVPQGRSAVLHLPGSMTLLLLLIGFAMPGRGERLRSDEETARVLPEQWRGVEHLPNGFPEEYRPRITAQVSNGRQGMLDLWPTPTPTELADLRRRAERGALLDYYFLPQHERYRNGPGLTGDEVLGDIRSGRFTADCKHSVFTYGFYVENVRRYYFLYRVSGDPYYVEQIARYADGAQWLLDNRPQQFLPEARRDTPLPDPMSAIPHEPIAVANFFPHVNAARLRLEEARKHNAEANDPRVTRAKTYVTTATRWMNSRIRGPFPDTFGKASGDQAVPTFTPGKTTLALVEQYDLPPLAAFTIEYTPWNQTFFYFATIAAAARALDDLGRSSRPTSTATGLISTNASVAPR